MVKDEDNVGGGEARKKLHLALTGGFCRELGGVLGLGLSLGLGLGLSFAVGQSTLRGIWASRGLVDLGLGGGARSPADRFGFG